MDSGRRIEALKARHAALDAQLDAENKRVYPDGQQVNDLKRRKLEIKEEIDRLLP